MSEPALVASDQVLELPELEGEPLPALSHLGHPVSAYLNGLAPSSRRRWRAPHAVAAVTVSSVVPAARLPAHRGRTS